MNEIESLLLVLPKFNAEETGTRSANKQFR